MGPSVLYNDQDSPAQIETKTSLSDGEMEERACLRRVLG